MKSRKKQIISNFTLAELVVSMGIFTILMLILVQFTDAAQKIWTNTGTKVTMYEDARVALDLISRDLQGVLYNDEISSKGIYPFWHEAPDRINFIASTNVGDEDDAPADKPVPKIREIKYARTNSTLTKGCDPINSGNNLLPGLLVRAVTGDNAEGKCNFSYIPKNITAGGNRRVYHIFKAYQGSTSSPYAPSPADYSGTIENVPSTKGNGFDRVIPYVVALKFTCFHYMDPTPGAPNSGDEYLVNMLDKDENGIECDGTANVDYDYVYDGSITANSTPLPYSVQIELTLLDKNSWEKWLTLGGNIDDPDGADTPVAKQFRENNQRTFSKLVFIGDRESY